MTRFKGIVEPITVPVEIKDKWYEKLIELTSVIYGRIMTKIPDEQAYINKLAVPSYTAWSGFVSPYWADVDLIRLKQRIKVSMAGPKYIKNVVRAYIEEARFEKGVAAARFTTNALDMFRYTLGGVGIRYKVGWGAIYKAIGVITGDTRVVQYISGNDVFEGPVVRAFPSDIVRFVRAALIGMLTQGAVLAYYAIERGLTTERDLVISYINSKTDKICSSLKLDQFTTVYVHLKMEDLDGDNVDELIVEAVAE